MLGKALFGLIEHGLNQVAKFAEQVRDIIRPLAALVIAVRLRGLGACGAFAVSQLLDFGSQSCNFVSQAGLLHALVPNSVSKGL